MKIAAAPTAHSELNFQHDITPHYVALPNNIAELKTYCTLKFEFPGATLYIL